MSTLQERGIAAAAEAMGWKDGIAHGITGWVYTVDDGTSKRQRIKNSDKNAAAGKKYVWLGDSTAPKYYFHPTLAEAIDASGGTLIIANGEPGVLTFHEAGHLNVLCFFGEGTLPLDLADRLAAWNVKRVMYYPDIDEAGRAAAGKLRRRLTAAGIDFDCRQLPATLPQKSDTNDLWQLVQFDPARFLETLDSLPAALLPAADKPARVPSTACSHLSTEFPPDFLTAVNQRVESLDGFKRWDSSGWANFKSPFRDEANASAGYNRISFGYNDFAGESMGAIEFARRLGIEIKDFRPRIRLPRDRTTAAPGNKPPAPDFQPFETQSLAAQSALSAAYIQQADMSGNHDMLIKSDMGTGKTTAVAALLKTVKTALCIVHRQTLSKALAEAFDTENYKGLAAADLRAIPKLTIVVNSVHKLLEAGQAAPRYELLVIDEVEQVLSHLGGGTFKGSEAETAYNTLKALVKAAGRVICLDAHASSISQTWLKAIRGDDRVQTIVNTFTRQRGSLTVYSQRARLVERAAAIADEDAGTVVLATSSKREAKTLESFFTRRYGAEAVFCVHGENNTPEKQAVLDDINAQIGQFRVFIYSPTVGSGVDIQTPVRAVCGLFYAQPISATDCHQMLNRCRNPKETLAYVQRMEAANETDVSVIYYKELQTALKTGYVANFDENGVATPSDSQKGLHRLVSSTKAQTNASLNRLYDHFLTLAIGYSETLLDPHDAEAVKRDLTDIDEVIREREKQDTLASTPIDPIAFERLQMDGKVTAAAQAGLKRWKMEKAAGRELTEELYQYVESDEKRSRIYTLTDALHGKLDDMKARDRAESTSPIHKRRHHARRWLLLQRLIADVWGSAGLNPDTRLEADAVSAAMGAFIELHKLDIYMLFDRRTDISTNPIAILRWFVGKLGLRLASVQVMDNGTRKRVYQIEAGLLDVMTELALTCNQRRESDKLEREATKNQDAFSEQLLKTRIPLYKSARVLSNAQHIDWVKDIPGYTYHPELSDVPVKVPDFITRIDSGQPANPYAQARA